MQKSLIVLSCVWLSACSAMERYTISARQPADFQLTDATATIRLTTDAARVFATPNANCVDLSRSGLINDQRPESLRSDLSFWSFKSPQTKEFITHDLGVKGLSVEQMQQMGLSAYGYSYISKDMVVNADKPLTIFIPKMGSGLGALLSSAVEEFGFGLSFTPQKNRQYQLIIENKSNSSWGGPGTQSKTTYAYRASLLDVTDGDPVNITRSAGRIKPCDH
ncbi:hypothetical protein [Snodgrassella sp. CFCC 13594]|uniref:hypothetical protein n=1 Tax=Snodgrassella sp. CFCC 13594 TaxID=1775559 RepID=UPI0008365BA0|nr:hypothetical protein [Snodgrassella sp. CFCC 13594]